LEQEATVPEIILITDTETQTTDSQVQVITETENDRDIQARVVGRAVIIPYNKGDKAMSEREANEEARHGEMLRWSTDSDNEEVTQRGPSMNDTLLSIKQTLDTDPHYYHYAYERYSYKF
jgi:hypothetical protein